MKNENFVEIPSNNYTVINNNDDYKSEIKDCFSNVPNVAECVINNADKLLKKVEKLLYTTPSFINILKASIPDASFQAILDKKQKAKLAKGTIKLMTKKDGSLMANLVNVKTGKIVDTVSLEKINLTPEITQAINNFSMQMQIAQIAEQIQFIQFSIEEVRQGQEYDRLATAYSCQQKLIQIMAIKNLKLRQEALLNLVSAAEDSRNLLMQSQSANITYIKNQPSSFIGKFLNGAKQDEIGNRINQIRESLNAVNMVSLVEAIAYQEMGENLTSKISLGYYSDYINTTYLSDKKLLERLDLIDPSPNNYWSKNLPIINQQIKKILNKKEALLKEGGD